MDVQRATWTDRIEPWVFGALILLHAIPVLAFPWFPTLDGPAHLYNARIIGSLLRCDLDTARFFELNPFPEPNWLGHAIMAAVMSIATPQAAEKAVMLFYVVGLPLSFRFALKRLGAGDPWTALLIFPFIYGFAFRIGFLNFSLGLPLLLLAVGVGARWGRSVDKRQMLGLGSLLTLLYFAHLTCFLLAVGLLIVGRCWPSRTVFDRAVNTRDRYRRCRPVLFSALPGLLLCIAFFASHAEQRAGLERLPWTGIASGLLNGRPFVSLSDTELPYARMITWIMFALTATAVVEIWRDRQRSPPSPPGLVLTIAVLVPACFLVPDQMATGGFITVRLILFTYLLWALWIALRFVHRWWNHVGLCAMMIADLFLLRMHYDYTRDLNAEVSEVFAIAPAVPEHAVIVPLNYSGNWLHSNWPCYMGTLRTAEVLDNFGARTAHMPVRWRDGIDPSEAVGSFTTSDRPCVDLAARTADGRFLIDHVLTWKLHPSMTDSCTNAVRRQLDASFVEVTYSPSGDARLYRRR